MFQITGPAQRAQFHRQPWGGHPPAAIRQGIGLPYGRNGRRLRLLQEKKLEGTVVHGTHQTKALSAEEAQGYILTCCAVPQTDVVLESRQVTDESAFPSRRCRRA